MFYDKNGIALAVGDHIIPDEGRELHIVSEAYVDEIGEDCMFGQQVEDPRIFSILTHADLEKQWSRKGSV